MYEAKINFNKILQAFLKERFPEVSFYPEPYIEKIKYPCVVLHYQGTEKTDTNSILRTTVQVDILYNNNRRLDCDILTTEILRYFNLTADVPGRSRQAPMYDYVDCNGKPLQYPIQQLTANLRFMLADGGVNVIYELDMPELMRNAFDIEIYHKDI